MNLARTAGSGFRGRSSKMFRSEYAICEFTAGNCSARPGIGRPVIDGDARKTQPTRRMRVGKLNVDENPVKAARFRIRSIPALPMFKGGSDVDRIVGAQPKSEILRHIGRVIA